MYAVRIEAVPSPGAVPAPEALEEELAVIADGVMLPGHVEDVPFHSLHDLAGDGELLGRGQVAHISAMNDELRLHRGHLRDRIRQGVLGGGVRTGLEADVRIADLTEGEAPDLSGLGLTPQPQRARYPDRERPQHTRAAPQQALHGLPAVCHIRFDNLAHVFDLRIGGGLRRRARRGAADVQGDPAGTPDIPDGGRGFSPGIKSLFRRSMMT